MDSEITLEDLPKVIENINKCMHVYKYWEAKYKQYIKTIQDAGKTLNEAELQNLQKNYDNVMNALVVCFDFIEKCEHILTDCRTVLLFGVIYVSAQSVQTDNEKLINKIEKYKKWYITGKYE
jgi:hypothetical protein